MKPEEMLGGGSHLPVLALAVHRTTGPVLECGIGIFSTALLHLLCLGRPLVSLESDAEWLSKLSYLRTPTHEFHHVPRWDDALPLLQSRFWDVAFVDHGDGEHRRLEVERLAQHARFIVVHDSELASQSGYHYEPTFAQFTYRTDVRLWMPETTVVSNFEKFEL
jgi:hypothetical protein